MTKLKPVAWQWLDTGNFRKTLPERAVVEEWNGLYSLTPDQVELLEKYEALKDRVILKEHRP